MSKEKSSWYPKWWVIKRHSKIAGEVVRKHLDERMVAFCEKIRSDVDREGSEILSVDFGDGAWVYAVASTYASFDAISTIEVVTEAGRFTFSFKYPSRYTLVRNAGECILIMSRHHEEETEPSIFIISGKGERLRSFSIGENVQDIKIITSTEYEPGDDAPEALLVVTYDNEQLIGSTHPYTKPYDRSPVVFDLKGQVRTSSLVNL